MKNILVNMQELNQTSNKFPFISTKDTTLDRIKAFLLFIFGIVNFLSLFAFSSIHIVNPSAATIIGRINSLLIILLFIVSMLLPKTPRQIIFWLCFGMIAIIDYRLNHSSDFLNHLILLGLSLGSLKISFDKILKTYLFSSIISTANIISLSLVGLLPIYGQQTSVLFSSYQNIVFCFGFIHPNSFGTILFAIAISFIYLYANTHPRWSLIISVATIAFDFLIGAQTAAIGVFIVLIGLFFQKKEQKKLTFLYRTAYAIPVLLFIFSLTLARSQGTSLYAWFNQHIASRPAVWNYYLSNYRPKLMGNVINIDLSAVSSVYGNGVLDGSYIYYLLHFGYIGVFVLAWLMISINRAGFVTGKKIYHWVFLAVCLTAFPESNFTIFFFNPFLYLLFYSQLGQEQKKYL